MQSFFVTMEPLHPRNQNWVGIAGPIFEFPFDLVWPELSFEIGFEGFEFCFRIAGLECPFDLLLLDLGCNSI